MGTVALITHSEHQQNGEWFNHLPEVYVSADAAREELARIAATFNQDNETYKDWRGRLKEDTLSLELLEGSWWVCKTFYRIYVREVKGG